MNIKKPVYSSQVNENGFYDVLKHNVSSNDYEVIERNYPTSNLAEERAAFLNEDMESIEID